MKYLAVCLFLAGAAAAQTPAPTANAPAAAKPPAANAPAAAAPAANAPAGNAPVSPAAPAATSKVTVRVPSGGDYTVYIQEASAAPKTIQDKADLEVPAGAKSFTVYVLDPRSGYAARKTVDAKSIPAELAFASPDFRLVQKVRVEVTGKDSKPIAQGAVALTDGGKNTLRKIIQPASQGTAEFDFVASGVGSVSVTPEGGSATSKEVNLDLQKGETVQTISVALPEVTAVVEPAAGTAPAVDANAPAPAANGPGTAANAPAPAATAQPTSAQPLPQPGSGGVMAAISSFICTLLQFAIVIGLIVGGLLFAKSRGYTVETVLKKMGVQPDAQVQGGGSLAGANLATGAVAPGPAPAPPPVVADPNQCPFCGQMKDPSGGCACQVAPGSLSAPAGFAGASAAPMAGSGPRLVGMAGTYMGQVFPVAGSAVIGREPANGVPLDRDTTASRRHAQISADAGGYRIQDLGSANGTFVNGARVTESLLNPGDEVSIGGTRFRFEV